MYRYNRNQLLVSILIALAFTSFLIMRYSMSRAPSLSPADSQRISDLEGVISRLQKQVSSAEANEMALRIEIGAIEAKARDFNNGNDGLAKSNKTVGTKGDMADSIMNPTQLLDCTLIDGIKITRVIAQGHTKVVQEGVVMGQKVAVKSATSESRDVKECQTGGVHTKPGECYLLASYKVLKEMMVLRQLHHRNIVGLLGMCVRSENSSPAITERGVTMVVELGVPVQLHKLKERSWPTRVEMCMQLAGLLEYLSDSPMGSIALPDVRDEQFVMVGDTIKLSDLDDTYASEPSCDGNKKCPYNGAETNIECQPNSKCAGMNAHANLQRLNALFFTPLLREGLPPSKEAAVAGMLKRVAGGDLDAGSLRLKLEGLLT